MAVNIVAHRGASAAEAENTPAAFTAADRLGADGVELDVRLTVEDSGGLRLVVHHDPLPDDRSAVDALPSFVPILESCGERMLINVEIKNSDDDGGHDPTMAVVAPTVAAMRRFDPRTDRWLVSSFSASTIDHVRRIAPEYATALLCYPLDDATIDRAVAGGHPAIHPHGPLVDRGGVEAAHRAGLAVNVWTVNDPDQMRELDALGVDGICTDVPDVASEVLGRNGRADPTPTWFVQDGA